MVGENRSNFRKAFWMAAGFVAVLFAGDTILSRVQWPNIYGSRNLSRATWERFDRSTESFDVIYLGCSYEWYGISPRAVDLEVERLGNGRINSLNLSSAAASMVTNYLLARRIVESGRLPKLVYLDISPDATDVSQSSWLLHGLRSLGDVRDLPIAASVGTDAFLETSLSATFRSYSRWDDASIAVGRVVLAAPVHPKLKMRFDDRGWAEWIGGERELRQPPGPPAQASHGADNDSNASRPLDANAVALRRTVELLQTAGVEVRLLEVPMAKVAAPWDCHDGNEAYLEWIRTATAGLDVPIVRTPEGLAVDSDFFDPVHLNARGALKFSRWLARDVVAALSGVDGVPTSMGLSSKLPALDGSRRADGRAKTPSRPHSPRILPPTVASLENP